MVNKKNNAESAPMNDKRVRVFIASSGDVAEERELAREVIDKLRNAFRYRDRIKLDSVAWDQPGAGVAQEATLTPQAAIKKGLPKPSDCDVVVVLFWSRIGTPLPAEYTKPDGSRYLSGTEWEFCDAMNAAREHGRPKVWLYRRTEVPKIAINDTEREQKQRQWDRVEQFFKTFTDEDGALLGGINSYVEPEDFRLQLAEHLSTWLDRLLVNANTEQQHPSAPAPSIITWKGTPYPGLRAFLPDEAPIFFGRERETRQLLDRLATAQGRFVAVVGASGSGKSSLVAAGLLPQLKANAIDHSGQWLNIRFKPAEIDDNPFMALAMQLAPKLEKHQWRAGDLAAQLAEMPSLFTERLIAQVRDVHPGTTELLLVIDQFEEVFTRCDPTYLRQFIDLLETAASNEDMRVVLTMRADYYRNCVEWPALSALLNQGVYSLSPPGVVALLEMIQGPARLAGLTFENGLADRMLEDTGQAPGRLALIAYALEKLYEGKTDRQLTHQAYEAFGGVRGAIAQKAEQTCVDLQDQGVAIETAFSQVFRELTSIDPERNVTTRKRASSERFSGDAERLKDALVEARLLVSDKGKVEVAHEVLFDCWPRLQEWKDSVSDDLRLHDRVKAEARAWSDAGHDPNHLWSHERLAPVYEMLDRLGLDRDTLDEPMKSFVRPEAERLQQELEQDATSHYRRAAIGDRLAQFGDPREGVGLDAEGVPQIRWVPVSPGHVTLEDDAGSQDVPVFSIAKYTVTFCQYRAFLEAEDGYEDERWWKNIEHKPAPGEQYRPIDNHPAEYVSWYDAIAFCRWLSARLGYEVRTPNEFEWQQAATMGDPDRVFPWGPDWEEGHCNSSESRLSRTTAVGMHPQGAAGGDPEGVMDMAGNVWEWCLNRYDDPKDDRIDRSGDLRVLRGGSWGSYQDLCRAANRLRSNPDYRSRSVGFRLLCPPS